jgi:hypothetical protein
MTMRIETSVKVYRFLLKTTMSPKDFAFRNKNCVISSKDRWRCTYHGHDFTTNIFKAKKVPYPALVFIFFTQTKPIDSIVDEMESLIGVKPDVNSMVLTNWVEKVYTPHKNIDLEALFCDLDSGFDDLGQHFVIERKMKKERVKKTKPGKIPKYFERNEYDSDDSDIEKPPPRIPTDANDNGENPKINLDQQTFCGIILTPFPTESNVVLEIFASGVINVAGIPNDTYFEKVKNYINVNLLPLMKNNNF